MNEKSPTLERDWACIDVRVWLPIPPKLRLLEVDYSIFRGSSRNAPNQRGLGLIRYAPAGGVPSGCLINTNTSGSSFYLPSDFKHTLILQGSPGRSMFTLLVVRMVFLEINDKFLYQFIFAFDYSSLIMHWRYAKI